jgi:hypothetical protein
LERTSKKKANRVATWPKKSAFKFVTKKKGVGALMPKPTILTHFLCANNVDDDNPDLISTPTMLSKQTTMVVLIHRYLFLAYFEQKVNTE